MPSKSIPIDSKENPFELLMQVIIHKKAVDLKNGNSFIIKIR
jgi:hypothetical protein